MEFDAGQIKRYWDNNLMLDVDDVHAMSVEDIRSRYMQGSKKWDVYHAECLNEYVEFMKIRMRYANRPPIGSPNLRDYSQNGWKATEPAKRKKPAYLDKPR